MYKDVQIRAGTDTHTHTLMSFTHSINPVFSPSDNMIWNKSHKYKRERENMQYTIRILYTILKFYIKFITHTSESWLCHFWLTEIQQNERSMHFKYLLNADTNWAFSFFRLVRLHSQLLNTLIPTQHTLLCKPESDNSTNMVFIHCVNNTHSSISLKFHI